MIETITKTLNKQKKEDGGKKFGIKINVFGATGSGKTHLAKGIVRKCFKKPLIYRMTDDFDKEKVFMLSPKNYIEDLDEFIKRVIELGKEGIIDSVIFDEADMLFPNNKPLTPIQKDLEDKHRHYGLSIVHISRRPQNINTFITEEAHFSACFSIEGENALSKFNGVFKGWGDLIRSLEYKSYKYTFKELGKAPIVKEPINI